ncbi:6177_t:CDS:2, partial [Paraglomus brasilianum]
MTVFGQDVSLRIIQYKKNEGEKAQDLWPARSDAHDTIQKEEIQEASRTIDQTLQVSGTKESHLVYIQTQTIPVCGGSALILRIE